MFNIKTCLGLLGVTLALLFTSIPLEAGHCHRGHCRRTNVSINVSPTYTVASPAYAPVYAPVYGFYPAPAPVVVYPTPVYRPVCVAPSFGFSLNWLFH